MKKSESTDKPGQMLISGNETTFSRHQLERSSVDQFHNPKRMLKQIIQMASNQQYVLSRLPHTDGIVLTFDDGPHAGHTEKILRILDDRGIKALFFVLGSALSKYPTLAKSVSTSGHSLGNHTYEHLNLQKAHFKKSIDSIAKTQKLIDSLSDGVTRKYLRAPWGALSVRVLIYSILHRYRVFGWTWDSRDSFIANPDELLCRVIQVPVRPGDIVLFHEDYAHTVAALPKILDHYLDIGLHFILP
jgi:peptidoglycan-N-acetylglucosamine deacetylase